MHRIILTPTSNANVLDFSSGTNTKITRLLFNLVEAIKEREENNIILSPRQDSDKMQEQKDEK
jgi:hypothetical protein